MIRNVLCPIRLQVGPCLLLIASLLGACSGERGSRAAATPQPSSSAKPQVVELPRQLVTPQDATSVSELFAMGEQRARAGDLRGAAAALDRAYELDPNGPQAEDAWFRAAEAWDLLKDNEQALARYEQVARRFPTRELGRESLVRAIRLLAYLERW
ncbi:MAG TPA: tetratricopeptide repeat protein, partial [Polyangiaceae bacterium]|nr:tetratricopeptide repeat protein [Polyangiaceae bacterium]